MKKLLTGVFLSIGLFTLCVIVSHKLQWLDDSNQKYLFGCILFFFAGYLRGIMADLL